MCDNSDTPMSIPDRAGAGKIEEKYSYIPWLGSCRPGCSYDPALVFDFDFDSFCFWISYSGRYLHLVGKLTARTTSAWKQQELEHLLNLR